MKKIIRIIEILFGKSKQQKKFEAVLPVVFDDIDSQLPALIGVLTGYQVEELIKQAIEKATGDTPTEKQVQTVVGLYSPIKAALKALKE